VERRQATLDLPPPLAHAHTERASVDSPKLDEKNDKAKTGGGGQGGTVRVVALPLFQTERERKTYPAKPPPHRPARFALLWRTNLPVAGLSLNRSQYGGCSTKYDTPTDT